jgi:prepilin-type N-terminal cleavage/methylation domain-containing protein
MKIKGFSLIEVIIVMAIIGIVSTIASFAWHRYVANSNLTTGARKVAGDFAMYKAKAIAEGRNYTITINKQPNNNYDISAPAVVTNTGNVVLDAFVLNGVAPAAEASQAQDTQIAAVNFNGGSVITATQRGLVIPPAGGTITLANSLDKTAMVTINSRGRVDVTYP